METSLDMLTYQLNLGVDKLGSNLGLLGPGLPSRCGCPVGRARSKGELYTSKVVARGADCAAKHGQRLWG